MGQWDEDTYDMDDLTADAWGRLGWDGFPEMSHAGGGVASHYDPRIAREILRRVIEGETVAAIAQDPDLPSYATIFTWVKRHPDFRWRWRAVRRHLAQGRVEKLALREASRQTMHHLKKQVNGGPLRGQGGRRSGYRRAIADRICDRMAAGEPVSAICADPRMPSVKAIYSWLRKYPAFRQMFVDARAHWLWTAEEGKLKELEDMYAAGGTPEAIRAARKRMREIEGRLGRLTPKTYRLGAIRRER